MRQGVLFVVSGPAGSGKGTVVERLCANHSDVGLSVSMTTRKPRKNDIEGVTYYFTAREDFERRILNGEFLEYNIFSGNNEYYGTPKFSVEKSLAEGKDIILEIEVNGAMNVKKQFPNAVTIMLTPPDAKTLNARLRGRGSEEESEILNRLETAKKEIKLLPEYDYSVVNEDGKIDECAELIYTIIKAERQRTIYTKSIMDNFND